MAAKRAPVPAKKKSASSPKPAPKMAKAATRSASQKASPSAKAAAKKMPSAKAAVKKTPSAKAVPKPAPPVKAAPKKAPPTAKKASASNGKKPAVPSAAAPKAKAKAAPASKPAKTAAARSGGLAVGDAVPGLDLSDHEGNPFSLSSLGGQSYVLYFYPKDDTPGCTREACAFRDDLGKFEGQGVRIIGISPDKPESHARFRTKYGLPFTLLSDADKVAANAFGVWVKKQNYGREYMGIERSTFFVDADGKVKKVWRNVKVDGHAQSVLDAAAS